jgi:hypothetical protein
MKTNTRSLTLRSNASYLIPALVLAVLYGLATLLFPIGSSAQTPTSESIREDIQAYTCALFPSRCAPEEGDGGSGDGDGEGEENGGGDTGGTDPGDTPSNGGGGTLQKSVSITLRDEQGIAVQGTQKFPATLGSSVRVTSTDGAHTIAIPTTSALATLVAFDEVSESFAITDLVYYPSFQAFFLNCITIAGEGELCGNWQYAVNTTYPGVGLDAYTLKSGDTLYLFFGTTKKVSAPTTVTVGESFTATVSVFDPATGTYVGKGGYTLGITENDPENPFTPKEIVVKETTVDGSATFTLTTMGTYGIGIKEDYYFPMQTLQVVSKSGSGGGSLISDTAKQAPTFEVPLALSFMKGLETNVGTFGAPLYTDWATLALVAGKGDTSKLRAYLLSDTPVLTTATDVERRAMALMALGINPYTGTKINYIQKLLTFYGGVQIGDPALVNDDIFGLIVLNNAGYGENDEIIQNTIAFLAKEQKSNGSWENSIDLTSAGIQALTLYPSLPQVSTMLAKAKIYLKTAQATDGGFGNSFATAWAVQAIHALGDRPEDWSKGNASPLTYLASLQASDGGVDSLTTASTTRLWATSYVVPAVLGMTWNAIMDEFEKPAVALVGQGAGTATPGTSTGTPMQLLTLQTEDAPQDNSTMGASTQREGLETADGADTETLNDESAQDDTQLASAVDASQNTTSTVLRVLTVVFALLLIGYGVFHWRRKDA